MKNIHSIEEFEQVLKENKDFFFLKHSLTCPISSAAFKEVENYTEANPSISTVYLAVQEARPLSNHIAEKYQIKHESPQAILFANGSPVWHASHWGITAESLTKALEENS